MRRFSLNVLLLLAVIGCSNQPYKLAPVSGRVTLNGRPLPKAWVHFAPKATPGNIAPGKTSHGQTDADGKFTLGIDPETPGAVVGINRVFITTLEEGTREVQDAGIKRTFKDQVPLRYNQETILEFPVPPGGSDKANFDLKSP